MKVMISGTNSDTRVMTSGSSMLRFFISSKNSFSKCLLTPSNDYPLSLAFLIILSSISVIFMHNYRINE
jgi:hypothetical protein